MDDSSVKSRSDRNYQIIVIVILTSILIVPYNGTQKHQMNPDENIEYIRLPPQIYQESGESDMYFTEMGI